MRYSMIDHIKCQTKSPTPPTPSTITWSTHTHTHTHTRVYITAIMPLIEINPLLLFSKTTFLL